MSSNPYESPKSVSTQAAPQSAERAAAKRSVQIALLILLLPAAYNFFCFHVPATSGRPVALIPGVVLIVNAAGFLAVTIGVWFLGVALLEFLTGGLHTVLARHSKLEDWKTILHVTLRRAPLFAVGWAVMWAAWVFAIYQMRMEFFSVSVPLGFAAHIWGVGWYGPLFMQWHALERRSEKDA